jgi:Legionella pneumophila major outer membrane protein precursor
MAKTLAAVLGLLLVAGATAAQSPGPCAAGAPPLVESGIPATNGPVQVMLLPVEDPNGAPPAPLLAPFDATVGVVRNGLRAEFGFAYLQPHFPDRSVRLAVPATPGSPAVIGDPGNLSNNFAFVPRFGVDYQFADLGFGLAASGEVMNFSGHLRRTENTTTGSALLNATSAVDIAVANVVEGSKVLPLADLSCLRDCCLGDGTAFFTLGARYAYVHQNFTANLTSGNNVANLAATQDFNGFGVTSSVGLQYPLGLHFTLFGNSRGSLLVGPNDRTSSLSVVTPANPATTVSPVVTENKTDLLLAGEFEVGLGWGTVLRPGAANRLPGTGTLVWARISFLTEIWGDLGLLSASDASGHFSSNNLLLYGFAVTAGINY